MVAVSMPGGPSRGGSYKIEQGQQKADTGKNVQDPAVLSQIAQLKAAVEFQKRQADANLRLLQQSRVRYSSLSREHKKLQEELTKTDSRINEALSKRVQPAMGPLAEFRDLQNKTMKSVGLGGMTNRTSMTLGAMACCLGLLGIIGRNE